MAKLARFLRNLPLLLLSPLFLALAMGALAALDLVWWIFGRRRPPVTRSRSTRAASVVIPNWNGRDLLERYLPSVITALEGNPANEIIVVDNGSTDGSADFVRARFPQVNLLALDRNLGFGGGSNRGFEAANNDIVVLLNSDMRVAPDFLPPLLEAFEDDAVFAVACQIFFTDPNKRREETGLSEARWRDGTLRVSHRIDDRVREPYPCFYGGGGSSAFDRRRFLELGGFDALLAPFYLEDTDVGYGAWKRGWKILYQPRSRVWHEHRGTIGRHFSREYIESVYRKNYLLFAWKNMHSWRKLAAHFFFAQVNAAASALLGDAPLRTNPRGIWGAFRQLPGALASRWRARSLAAVGDDEALRRPIAGYHRDRFVAPREAAPEKLRVLFVSPYPICPPVHGGAVFMHATIRELAARCELHLIVLLDSHGERAAHEELERICASVEYMVRLEGRTPAFGSILPHSVRDFASDDLFWLIHRQIYTRRIDVVQYEYTPLAQYRCDFRHVAQFLFEHDVYFQSVGRAVRGPKSALEYLRALHYETTALGAFDRVQVCSRENGRYLTGFARGLRGRVVEGQRAGIDVSRYEFRACGREPGTMLFLGSFRHLPNHTALEWFVQKVLPRILDARPDARLLVIGSDPPPPYAFPSAAPFELRGFVEDIREPLARCAVFVCPILSGSGVRVKLLEAFAAGIPVVSTRLGAEGLARVDGEFCALADTPDEFARKVIAILDDPAAGAAMAGRARREVETNWDMAVLTARLVESYREAVAEKRPKVGQAETCATSV